MCFCGAFNNRRIAKTCSMFITFSAFNHLLRGAGFLLGMAKQEEGREWLHCTFGFEQDGQLYYW